MAPESHLRHVDYVSTITVRKTVVSGLKAIAEALRVDLDDVV
jgi:hypothetical protein